MSGEWNKGPFSTGPQRTQATGPGRVAHDRGRTRQHEWGAQATSDRDQRFRDQMLREAIRTASGPSLEPAGRFAGGGGRKGIGGIWALGALGLIVIYLLVRHGAAALPAMSWPRLAPAAPSAHAGPAPVAGAAAPSLPSVSAADAPKPAVTAAVVATPTTAVPVFERFGLRRLELSPGDALELVVAWQPSDGIRRPGRMDAFVVTRDAARRRIAVVQGWAVFPGATSVPLALPAGIAPGKYELETVWTVGGEAREERTNFTLADRGTAAPVAARATQPAQPALVAAVADAPVAEPAPTREPTPPSAHVVVPILPLAEAPAPTPRPSRAMASDPLYTGG
jgi:hypothetical protein